MPESLEEFVMRRAGGLCEYCRMPQGCLPLVHQMDHIIAVKHRGQTIARNLAAACFACNQYKSSNIAGIDPRTGAITRLFHPRRHKWSAHFRWEGPVLFGRTAIGRTTIEVLEINLPHRVAFRQALIEEMVFPPRIAESS